MADKNTFNSHLELTVNEGMDSPVSEKSIDVIGMEDSPEVSTGTASKRIARSPLDANQQLKFTKYGDYDRCTSNVSTSPNLVNYLSSPNLSPANKSTLTLKLKTPTNNFVIMSNFSKNYQNDQTLRQGITELSKHVGIQSVKKLRNGKLGITLQNPKELSKLRNNDFKNLNIFKQNPKLILSLPSTFETRKQKSPLYPVVIKNVYSTNDDISDLLNKNGFECKFVKQLENRRQETNTDHKLAYLVHENDRENLIKFGFSIDFFHYVCELPNFLKYTKQCYRCWDFGHTREN